MTINNMKQRTNVKPNETIVDFGEKKIPRQNYSRVITLDKKLLENCGCDTSRDSEIKARVELVKRLDEDFIKITPFCENKKVRTVAEAPVMTS